MYSYANRDQEAQILKDTLDHFFKSTLASNSREFFMKGFVEMKKITLEFLPYAAVTNFIYGHKDTQDFAYFNSIYLSHLLYYKEHYIFSVCNHCQQGQCVEEHVYCPGCENSIKVAFKVYEHMHLAQQQLDSFFHKHQEDIEEIQSNLEELEELKAEIKEISSSYISILGIFAAILMGAFGAMQGFSSLFENASELKMSKLLVISGVGGLTVIAILHMLLHSVAKLSGRSIRSVEDDYAPFYKKYPFFTLSVYILWGIIVSGVSLKYAQDQHKTSHNPFLFFMLIGMIVPLIVIKLAEKTKNWKNIK